MNAEPDIIIAHTKKWIVEVVIGCNFCPFAAREIKKESIRYKIAPDAYTKTALETLAFAFNELNANAGIETTLIILPEGFNSFTTYMQLVDKAEMLLEKEGYTGIYQLASFHPAYLFSDTDANDAANYTNRSPYPMLHILREESLSKAIDKYHGVENIPENNIAFAREKGLAQMQALRAACM